VYLLLGLKISILASKSRATGLDFVNNEEKLCLVLLASFKTNSLAWILVINSKSSEVGVPSTEIIF
jgi:hypothetical protein